MLALEIELLTGTYRATAFNDRGRAEWPIHPARVYSALVAALADGRNDDSAPECAALDRLAALPAPEIWASECGRRAVLDHYVPVNDLAAIPSIDKYLLDVSEKRRQLAEAEAASKKERARRRRAYERAADKLQQQSDKSALADGRGNTAAAIQLVCGNHEKQARTFPAVIPHDPTVHFVWHGSSLAPPHRAALNRLAARVARVGHSASLVRLRFRDSSPALGHRGQWRPVENGPLTVRLPLSNQRELLDAEHQRHRQCVARVLPYRPQRYGLASDSSPRDAVASPFASTGWLVYEVVSPPEGGARRLLHLSRAEELARAFRGAFLSAAPADLPEVLNGHAGGGGASNKPHLAFIPLADVGHEWATGSILGIALIPPRGLDTDASSVLLRTLARLEDPFALRPRHDIAVWVRRLAEPPLSQALDAAAWTGPAHHWGSVSAVALDNNPGRLDSRDPDVVARAVDAARAILVESCRNGGLPAPSDVSVHRRSLHPGAPAARRFMPFPRGGQGTRRVCVHVEIRFDVPVRGPLLLGAGRYFGVGLFRPLRRRQDG